MNTIHNFGLMQKYDDILLDILSGKVYAKYVAIFLHVVLLIHYMAKQPDPHLAGYDSHASRLLNLLAMAEIIPKISERSAAAQ